MEGLLDWVNSYKHTEISADKCIIIFRASSIRIQMITIAREPKKIAQTKSWNEHLFSYAVDDHPSQILFLLCPSPHVSLTELLRQTSSPRSRFDSCNKLVILPLFQCEIYQSTTSLLFFSLSFSNHTREIQMRQRWGRRIDTMNNGRDWEGISTLRVLSVLNEERS